jgi:alpha-2-macroglobulin
VRVLRWAGRFWTGILIIIVLLAALLLGLRLLLPFFAATPALLAATPADGDAGVTPRTRLTLRFDGPMNPRSVERAVMLRPAVAWLPIWTDDRTTLTISPTETLHPDTNYTLTLDTQALSRRFRALDRPIELHFRTAPAPAVMRVLPDDGAADVPLDAPISIRFSRTIVPADALMRPAALPELRFEPPLAGSVTWLDQTTALFRPTTPLHPGTLYRATIDAALSDTAGGQLNRPFTWNFSTSAPAVLDIAPADGAVAVAPRATLAITLSQPLDRDSLRASLLITPSADGDLVLKDLPDGRQLVLFAPFAGWLPATSYAVTLRAGAVPAGGNLPLLTPMRWSFTTAPQPALTGRFPGEGQTLPPGQEIQLIFNAPIDGDAIRSAIQLTPTADILRITTSDTEVRIAADVRAATPYTITLPATLTDRNGIPLGQTYRLRFVTAPSGPALTLPEAPAHLAQALPGQPASLLIRRINLSALNFDLYQLDEAAVVRTAGFRESDWALFQPERYGQPLLRSWSMLLADPLNQPAEERMSLATNAGAPLPAGAYYLRIRTPEGPRADLLALISRARLTLQSSAPVSGTAALVWATDIISGTPIAGQPVALYQSGTQIELSTTDANGLASFTRAIGAARPDLVALADGGRFGIVSSAWGNTTTAGREQPHLFLTTDRAVYRPGERVELAGFVRVTSAPSGTLGLARAATVSVSVRAPAATGRIAQEELAVSATGVFSGGLMLSAGAPPGAYTVIATLDGASAQTNFVVQPDMPAPLLIAVQTPNPPLVAGAQTPLEVMVHTPEGLPVAGAPISWTLDAERTPFPVVGDYTFGDAEREPIEAAAHTGTGQTDADGRFSLVISDTLAGDLPLRYRLRADATEPGGPSASAVGSFLVAPAPIATGARLPSRIFAATKAGAIELLAITPDGQAAPRASLRVEVYRRTWQRREEPGLDGRPRIVWRPTDKLAFTRGVDTDQDGSASLPLTLPSGGVYRLHVGTATDIKTTYSATTVWATAPGFTGWGDQPGDLPLLIADRASYRPGETATLLLTTPFPQTPVLITRRATDGLTGEARTIRAGDTFTLTVGPEDAPALALAVLFAGRPPLGTAAAPPPPLLATATLPVRDDRADLLVSIVSDRSAYAPGTTATLTVTTTNAAGVGVPADVIISIAGANAAPQSTIASASLAAATPPTIATAPRNDTPAPSFTAAPPAEHAPDPVPAPSAYWNPALRTGPSGVLTFTLQLPREPTELRALAWAAGPNSASQAASTLLITRPFTLQIEAPPRFRVGDIVELAARIQSTCPVTQAIQASLASAGVRLLDDVAQLQQRTLAPGAMARFTWRAEVLDVAGVRLNISVRESDAPAQSAQIEQPILPAGATEVHNGGIALIRDFLDPLTSQPLDLGQLRAGQLVRARLTVVINEPRRAVEIADSLPGNAILISADKSVDFENAGFANGRMILTGATLEPGIYQYSYMLRVVAGGRYSVPAPTARAADGASGIGNAAMLDVAVR